MTNRNRTALALAAIAIGGVKIARQRRHIALAGKTVLISGGSRGLGLVMAREFGHRGARVAICARDEVELGEARRDLEIRGIEVLTTPCDVSDPEDVEHWIEEVDRVFGRIDILVNNAGIIQVGPFDSMTREDFEESMDINFWGAVNTILAALPRMRRGGAGRIVNITSIGGKVAVPHLLPYDAAKFALVGFSEGLAAELAGEGIRVVTIVPGLMRTGSPFNAYFKGDQAKEFTWFSLGDATPLTAMSAERAAKRIAEATRRGEVEVTLTWQAKLLRITHDLFPGPTITLLGWINRLLPSHDSPTSLVRGKQLSTPLSPSPLTAMMNRAAERNNQFRPGEVAPV